MTQEESFVLCTAFRYAHGRQTFAMEIVVDHVCKQLDCMSAMIFSSSYLGLTAEENMVDQEENHVNRLEKELRGCLR